MNRFMFITTHYHPNVLGGAELSVQALAEELLRQGKRVVVVSLSTSNSDTVDHVNGIKVYRLSVTNFYQPFPLKQRPPLQRAAWHVVDVHNPIMSRKLGRILDTERPDCVSTHNLAGFSVSVWSAIKSRGALLSHMLHDYYLMCPRSTMIADGKSCPTACTPCQLYSACKRAASKQPDLAIGVSRFVLDKHLRDGFFPNALSGVVFNGRTLPAPPALSAGNDPPRPGLTIGFIGRLEPAKGLETLLRALTRLPSSKWKLLVAGKASSDSYIDDLKRRYPMPQVTYLGYVSSPTFYRQVDVVVVPSEWHEPLPAVTYEPLGYGVPVLASRVGGIPEILENMGCGWLFDPGNVDQLAAGLMRLLDGVPERETVRRRALERRAFFVPERQAAEFLELVARASQQARAS